MSLSGFFNVVSGEDDGSVTSWSDLQQVLPDPKLQTHF